MAEAAPVLAPGTTGVCSRSIGSPFLPCLRAVSLCHAADGLGRRDVADGCLDFWRRLLAALLAMALTAAVSGPSPQVDNERMRVAINNMSQGLCMFDGNERLVICNRPLHGDVSSSRDDVARRAARWQPARIPHRQRHLLARAGNTGKLWSSAMAQRQTTTTTEVKSHDGRAVCRQSTGRWPGAAGSPRTRTSPNGATPSANAPRCRSSSSARSIIERAIAAFRQRVEDHLRTVTDGAMAMRSTATALLASSGRPRSARRARCRRPTKRSHNVETAAIAADELCSSIGEISRQLASPPTSCAARSAKRRNQYADQPRWRRPRRRSATWSS